ncbi:unnamed protein product [Rhizoctonia solani]|uniref:Protein-S-isoprenylcysteine O-methyltransferase n=1 Tax=Rhizoctonia solani TaxID=456999 RepID=A0A8H3B3P9_9AGAM|nr:unnamed protein product [Rhizoctonia solani]
MQTSPLHQNRIKVGYFWGGFVNPPAMYVAGLNLPFTESQALNGLACVSLVGSMYLASPKSDFKKRVEEKAGKAVHMPANKWGEMITAAHGFTTFTPAVLFLTVIPFNKFAQPGWLAEYMLPEVIPSVYYATRIGCSAVIWISGVMVKSCMKHLDAQWNYIGVRERPEIVKTGPYRFVRHPMYSTVMLAMGGMTGAFWNWMPVPAPFDPTTMAQHHKASILAQKHGKLEVGTRPTPIPQGTQALVKVTAAATNPADWKIIDSGSFIEEFPAVLGFDGAGVVHAVGQEVTNFKVGDRVLFEGTLDSDHNSYQEYALVETDIIAKTPNNINDDQASTIPAGAVTAYFGLFQRTGIAAPLNAPTANGKPLLILGGSSSHTEFLKSLGATHVFERDVDAKTIRSAFPTPVALVFDAISEESTQLLAFEVLTTPSPVSGAHLTLLNPPTDSFKAKNSGDKIIANNVFGFSDKFRDLSVPFWQQIGQWIEGGEIVPNRVQLVKGGLAGVPEALDLSRKGVSGVKLVIRPQE